jgi:hypothetical protein
MISLKDLNKTAPIRDIQPIEDVLLGEASDVLGSCKADPPVEEVLIDKQSYFLEEMRNPWDSESILTTYFKLDNNPVTIGAPGCQRRGKNKKGIASECRRRVGPASCLVQKDWVTSWSSAGARTGRWSRHLNQCQQGPN